jgi:hypothetical protein
MTCDLVNVALAQSYKIHIHPLGTPTWYTHLVHPPCMEILLPLLLLDSPYHELNDSLPC